MINKNFHHDKATSNNEGFATNRSPLLCAKDSGIARGGKHCKSLEGNVWRKVVLTSKETIFEGVRRFFAAILSEMDLDHVGTWEV